MIVLQCQDTVWISSFLIMTFFISLYVSGWDQADVGGRQEQAGGSMADDSQQTTETQRPWPLLDGDGKIALERGPLADLMSSVSIIRIPVRIDYSNQGLNYVLGSLFYPPEGMQHCIFLNCGYLQHFIPAAIYKNLQMQSLCFFMYLFSLCFNTSTWSYRKNLQMI